jgi:phage-related tail fiber protein
MANSKDFVVKNGLQANGPVKFVAGTTTVAPAAFQAGSLLTTPAAHAIEWNGTNAYLTNVSGVRKALAYTDSNITGSANSLANARNIGLSGDATGSASFNGTTDATIAMTLANSGVSAGTYPKVTVDSKGRVTAGSALVAADIPSLDWTKIASGKPTTLAGYGITDAVNNSTRGVANGVATLDASGKVVASQMPAIAIVDTFVVASQAAMLGLTGAETGDIAVRTDLNKTFILKGQNYATLADWQELLTPTDQVSSVNGMQGAVTISAITGNAGTATALQTARTLAVSGDATGSASFNGTANATIAMTLANTVTAGTATKVTYDSKGRVTAGASLAAADIPALDWSKITSGKPTTLAGFGITDDVLYKSGDSMDGTLTLAIGTATVAAMKFQAGSLLTTPLANAVEWNGSNLSLTTSGAVRKTVAYTDSTITGNAANVTGIVAVANGGTGASTATAALDNLGAVDKAGDTMTGTLVMRAGTTAAAPMKFQAGALLTTPQAHAIEWNGTTLSVTNGSAVRKNIAYTDSTITGNAANVTGVVAVANGGTGATSLTGYVKGTGTGAMTAASSIPGSDISGNISGSAANVTGTVTVGNGGTGATTAAAALTNLGAQPALGFTPVQQGGGTGQGTNKVRIGWLGSQLGLHVDSTNFGAAWPIDVAGVAASASAVAWSGVTGKPTTLSGYGITDAVSRGEFRSFGIVTYAGGGTTAEFLAWLNATGFFNYAQASAKFSWSFAGNTDLTDTGFGAVELAGAVVETWKAEGAGGGTYGNIHVRIICPNSGGSAGQEFIYNDQGPTYAPGWRKVWTSSSLTNLNQLSNGPGYITAASSITGNAATATILATARTIQGVSFNGSANIALPVPVSGTDDYSKLLANAVDLNTIIATGFYRGSSLVNAPSAGWYFVTVEGHDTSWTKQTATSYGSGNTANLTFTRVKAGGTWTAWTAAGGGGSDMDGGSY